MLTIQQIVDVLKEVRYLNWTPWLLFRDDNTAYPYLQWRFFAEDTDTNELALQKGRKWQLSYHMTPQEIERTAYLALKQAVLHEMDENYTYKNVQIRNPHVDPDVLVEVIKNRENIIARTEHVEH